MGTKVKSNFCVGPSWKEARTEGINDAGADGNDDAVSRLGGAGHSYDESWTPPVIADTKARRKRFRKGSSYLLLFRKHRTPQVSFRLRGRGHGARKLGVRR